MSNQPKYESYKYAFAMDVNQWIKVVRAAGLKAFTWSNG